MEAEIKDAIGLASAQLTPEPPPPEPPLTIETVPNTIDNVGILLALSDPE
ncbi:hypothetical protein [Scytonema sp. PRP1]